MPALFALVVAVVSGINATAVIYVGIAPLLWIFYAVFVAHEATWRSALVTTLRMALLACCCLWWLTGPRRGELRRQRPEVHRDGPFDVARRRTRPR